MSFFDKSKDEKKDEKEVRKANPVQDTEFAKDDAHLDLRSEELDIHKHRSETGDVEIHKDIVEEEKSVDVPVSHDQVVIERKVVNREATEEPIQEEETIHIPVTAEEVDVEKHTVVTGEITAHARSVEETKSVHDVLHKEVADVEAHGDTDVINKDE